MTCTAYSGGLRQKCHARRQSSLVGRDLARSSLAAKPSLPAGAMPRTASQGLSRYELHSQKRQAVRARTSRLVGAARRLCAVRPPHIALLSQHFWKGVGAGGVSADQRGRPLVTADARQRPGVSLAHRPAITDRRMATFLQLLPTFDIFSVSRRGEPLAFCTTLAGKCEWGRRRGMQ
jgi:hypothetical protein